MLNGVPVHHSPNHSSRNGAKISGIVIHYTAGSSASGSISWLCNPMAKASAHFVISRDGDIAQLVDVDRQAWHAGVSEMLIGGEMKANANRYTIGIELANHGLIQKINGGHYYELGRALKPYRREAPQYAALNFDNGLKVEGWWEPYPGAQIDSLQELLLLIKAAGYGDAAGNLIGHEEIGMPLGRKIDPGPLFPWGRFYRKIPRRTKGSALAA